MTAGVTSRRVVLFIPRLHRGGAGKQVVHLATGLAQRGWDVRPLTLLPRGEYARHLEERGLAVTTLGASSGMPDPRVLVRCVRQLRRWRPDVIVAFLFHATAAARLCVPLSCDAALVSSVRNERFGGRGREAVQRLLRSVDDVTTVNSAAVARRLADRGVVDPARAAVAPNAIDPTAYGGDAPEGLRAELDVASDEMLWLAVGHLHAQKGYPSLLAAWRRVADAGTRAQLRIVGDGGLRDELEAEIRTLAVGDSCRLLGFREDVPDLLSAADAFVMSSRWEGAPNAVLEAMASRLPVVATRVGGVPELVDEDAGGRLVPAGDPEALAGAMLEVARMEYGERRRLGEQARERVERSHGVERVLDRWEEVLERAIREGGPRG